MQPDLLTQCSEWVWLPGTVTPNSYAEFRSFFHAVQGRTMLHICAEGRYAAWINGQFVPSGQYDDFPSEKSVQTPDITALLKPDENELLVQVWYPGEDTSVCRKEAPGLRFEVRQAEKILCASSAKTQSRRLAGYQEREVPNITPQLGRGFCYRPELPQPWMDAAVVQKSAVLAARPIRELQIESSGQVRIQSQGVFCCREGENPGQTLQYAGLYYKEMTALSARPIEFLPCAAGLHLHTEQGDGIYLLLDLGKTTSGFFVLDAVTSGQSVVDVAFGEHLEDLRVRSCVGGRCFAVSCCAGPERKRFLHPFRRLAGRYLQLFFYSRDVLIYEAGLLPVVYPVNRTLCFQCADHLHEQIYETARTTLDACMHEHYEDCPWREQALYAFDSRNQMLAGYYAFGEFDYARENLRLLARSQRPDGLLELCAPARVSVNIPSFSLAFLKALEEYCNYSGDIGFGREMLPIAERILENALMNIHDGVLQNYTQPGMWNFYEWSRGLDGMPMGAEIAAKPSADAGLQLFSILALQSMERLTQMTGADGQRWKESRRQLQQGLECFWDEERSAYAAYMRNGRRQHYAELIQALALYTDSCPAERAEALRERLAQAPWEPITLSYSIFRYEALLQEPEKYARTVFGEVARRWGKMLFSGASTFWETDKGLHDFDGAGSLCHGWSAIPIYLYGAYVLGVRPESPGVWRPQPPIHTGIYEARGTLLSPEGQIEVGTTGDTRHPNWFCLQQAGDKIYL